MPPPDFRLTVWYHGLKATQYFSKFTPESVTVLRKDLTILGLPHPKSQNITLLSHGAVECFWPAAAMNPALHKNIAVKTSPTQAFYDTLKQLSILNITVKETSATYPYTVSVTPTGLKRSYEQRASVSVTAVPMGQSADTPRDQQTYHNAAGFKPQPAHPSATTSHSFPSNCDSSSRPSKVAKTNAQVFQLSANVANNGHPSNYFEPSVPPKKLQVSTSMTPVVNPTSRSNPPRPPTRLATNAAPNMTITNLQPLRMPSDRGPPAAGVEKSTASNLEPPRQSIPLPRKLVSPSNGSSVRTESRGPTVAAASDKAGQVPGRNNSTTSMATGTAVQMAAPPPSSNFHPNLHSTTSLPTPVSPWLARESLQDLVLTMASDQGSNSTPLIPPSPTSVDTKETGPSAAAMHPAPQLAIGLEEVTRNIGEWFAEGHGVPRRNAKQDREKELELEKVIEELNVVRKELEEERRSRREDQELLDVERQRREEAEHALADVKRECRQPFVVPSLLDAFVDLSKLTTRGLRVSGSQVEVPVSHSRQDQVEGASRAVVNGRDITAEASSQRTKVKPEPLEDRLPL